MPSGVSLSLRPAVAAAGPAAAAVPAQARFWAIYMSGLHGECTPKTLQNLLHIPEIDANRYIGQLIADGVIKPNPLVQKTASRLLNSREDGVMDKVRKRLDMKKARMDEAEAERIADTSTQLQHEEIPSDQTNTLEETTEPSADLIGHESADEGEAVSRILSEDDAARVDRMEDDPAGDEVASTDDFEDLDAMESDPLAEGQSQG